MTTRLSELAATQYERSIIEAILEVAPSINRSADLQDVVQEVYLRVCEKEAQYDESRASPHTFIRTIARTTAVDWVRNNAKGVELVSESAFTKEDGDSYYDELAEAGPDCDPVEAYTAAQLEAQMDEAANAVLTDGEVAVYLGMKAGRTPKEIADDTGFTVSSVYVLRNRIRNKLKAC